MTGAYVVDDGACPWYAVIEADGGGYVIAQCDRPDGHDDYHHSPDVFPDFIDWTHPLQSGYVGAEGEPQTDGAK